MFRTMVRGLAVTAVMAALVGGAAAGAANAQQMSGVPSGHAATAVQPNTRDMSAQSGATKPATAARPAAVYHVHCDDGTRIRATPYGQTLGLCYWSHYVTANDGIIQVTVDGYVWDWTIDYTTGVSGWVRADCIWS